MKKLIMAGYGGQGMFACGQILSHTAMMQGYNVTCFPSYGAEVRGGAVACQVVISEKPVGSPVVQKADIVVVCSQPAYDKFYNNMAAGTVVIYNTALVKLKNKRDDVRYAGFDFSALSTELGFQRAFNMIVLGVITEAIKLSKVDRNAVCQSLADKFKTQSADVIAANVKGVDMGISEAKKVFSKQ